MKDCILYRAVTAWEWEDIKNQGNSFRSIPRSLEDKQFAISEACGHYYGREIVQRMDRVDYILLKVIIDVHQYCAEGRIMRLDDCDAVSIDRDELNHFNTCILKIEVVLRHEN